MRHLFENFPAVSMRRTTGFAVLIGLAALVGFLGQDLSIDGHRPLLDMGTRGACALFLAILGVLWITDGPWSLAVVSAAAMLVWRFGPVLQFGEWRPLTSVVARALLIGVLGLACALYCVYRLLVAVRAKEGSMFGLVATSPMSGAKSDDLGHRSFASELKEVDATTRRAVARLRTLRIRRSAWRNLFEGQRYLYELPWFLMVGSPGTGKSTAMHNAGLQFEANENSGKPSHDRGIGGRDSDDAGCATLHCDWLLSNEAVLIDTAGRYTTQKSDPERDSFEWRGFLALLKKFRPRAPINGAIIAIDMAELLTRTQSERTEHVMVLRERLLELRQRLGIRFPVYVIVTKSDVLRGFNAYFQSLTSEGRTQPLGMTLEYRPSGNSDGVTKQHDELSAGFQRLAQRLADGLRARMSEEFDKDRRRDLYALPSEFASASDTLREMLEMLFLNSRFDATQSSSMLRGVYFTSGAQDGVEVAADPFTIVQRLHRTSIAPEGQRASSRRSRQAFFLHDVFRKVIFPEAHLVRPNLRWELRFRIARLAGHSIAALVCAWLASAMISSYASNRDFLGTTERRATELELLVRESFSKAKPVDPTILLQSAQEMAAYPGLDTSAPPVRFTYGLYAAPPVVGASERVYAGLQELILLPPIVRRMEAVMAQSVKDRDSRVAYDTLRAYKMLHDRQHFIDADGASSVRAWVRQDMQSVADVAGDRKGDGSGLYGLVGRPTMALHVDALFSDRRVVQSASLPDEALIRAVQRLLASEAVVRRIYGRAKTAMRGDSPPEFSLVRAVGPQVGTVFARNDGMPLDKGVDGLFTYDGYHQVFEPKISAFVHAALRDDDWVMNARNAASASGGPSAQRAWVDDVRKQYLEEYALRWEAFLSSVRTAGSADPAAGSSTLGLDLAVLRQLAAPDSALARLARAAVRETTLSHPGSGESDSDRGMLGRAAAAANKFVDGSVGRPSLGDTDTAQVEHALVDNRFAALREVVTGTADAAAQTGNGGDPARQRGVAGQDGPNRLDAISALINDFYTWMVVADTALSAGGLPPGVGTLGPGSSGIAIGPDAASRLRLEAGKLPAPFKEILFGLAAKSAEKVAKGASDILRRQAQLQLDRLLGLMALQVSEPCKRGIDGRYPFAAVAQDASVEDFTLVFAVGGAFDEFFARYLAPWVDTSVRPWRYKSLEAVYAATGLELATALGTAGGAGAMPMSIQAMQMPTPANATTPTLLGEFLTLLSRDGPDLRAFYRAQQIRNVFFRESGGKKISWKLDLTIRELDPAITELLIDLDGQGQRYVHGPIQPMSISWPGPRGGVMAEITAQPRISASTSTLSFQGPWALFRLFDRGRFVASATSGRSSAEYVFDGRKAVIEIETGTQANPVNGDLLTGFRCPGRTA